jgi:hypothetical protein
MLRLLVLLLLLANAGYFAWSHGTLAPYGFAPTAQSEPQRLMQQLHPDALRILTPLEARQLENPTRSATRPVPPAPVPTTAPASAPTAPFTPASAASSAAASTLTAVALPALFASASSPGQTVAATQCLEAGLFNDEQTTALRSQLQSTLPTGSWAFETSVEPARWMIYMGKYSGADALAKKRAELRQLNVSFQPLNNPALEPGLSLGNFGSQLDADTELARIAKRGVKTARVLQAQAELRGQKLKLAAVTPALHTQLDAIKPLLLGKILRACH